MHDARPGPRSPGGALGLTDEEAGALDLARQLSERVSDARQGVRDLRARLETVTADPPDDVAVVHRLPGLSAAVTVQPDGTVVCAVEGELDVGTAPQLAQLLRDVTQPGRDLLVDLAAVPFVDSAALSVLLAARRRLLTAGDALALCRPSPQVARLLAVTRLDHLLAA